MAQQHNDNIPYYEIFSIREYVKEGETKSSWLRIGAGFKTGMILRTRLSGHAPARSPNPDCFVCTCVRSARNGTGCAQGEDASIWRSTRSWALRWRSCDETSRECGFPVRRKGQHGHAAHAPRTRRTRGRCRVFRHRMGISRNVRTSGKARNLHRPENHAPARTAAGGGGNGKSPFDWMFRNIRWSGGEHGRCI